MSKTMPQKEQIKLEKLAPGAVVLDVFGHAWQDARGYNIGGAYPTGYWYRAYDGNDASEVATHDLAFRGPFKILHRGEMP